MNTETKEMKCGLVMPISAIDDCSEGHWEEVRQILKEALSETPFTVELVSDSNEIGIIHKRIVQNIYDNDIVICDVSAKNPNVMLELGMRLAFDKPVIIIKDDKTNYSFDTSPIEHLQYPRDLHYPTIQLFKKKLMEKVVATHEASLKPEYTTFLKHFGQFVVAKIDEKKVGKDEFLLAAITELRSEVSLLSKLSRQRDEGFAFRSQNRLASLASMLPHEINDLSMAQFVFEYLKRHKVKYSQQELSSPSSQLFKKMLAEYLDKHVPANIAIKDRHVQLIMKQLQDTVNLITNGAG